MIKKIKIIIIILVVLLAALIIAKNIIAKSALSAGVEAITGLRLSMEGMNVGILKTSIDIKELKLHNPPGFPDELMANIPEIYIDYNLGAFLNKRVHLQEVRLNLKDFIVVKNEKNQLNLSALNVVKARKGQMPEQKKERAKKPEIQIDKLRLKVGKVIYRDYSRGARPIEREFNINLDEYYENITDPYALVSLIITKALGKTAIASIANLDLGPLQSGVTGTLKEAATLSKDAVQKALETSKEKGQEAVGAVGQALEKATETIKKVLPP
jgi:hypothetical protein